MYAQKKYGESKFGWKILNQLKKLLDICIQLIKIMSKVCDQNRGKNLVIHDYKICVPPKMKVLMKLCQ
jgi:hypothetical protein